MVFTDYGIDNPSNGTVKTEDHGLIEFVLVFVPATTPVLTDTTLDYTVRSSFASGFLRTVPQKSLTQSGAADPLLSSNEILSDAGWLRSQADARAAYAAEGDQFVVGAEFGQPAVIDDGDAVGTAHRREPVGDDDRRASRHQRFERLLDLTSVPGSRLLVASSSTSTAGSTSAARASETS